MSRLLTLLAGVVLVSGIPLVPAQEVDRPDLQRPLLLSLEVVQQEVKAGTTPAFRLTLKNTSGQAQRVLDIRGRPDLQHTYYELRVRQAGKPVALPVAISDPGPVTDKDFLSLPPGGTQTFHLTNFPMQLDRLAPGTYTASVLFWQDPYRSQKTSFPSPEVKFTVGK